MLLGIDIGTTGIKLGLFRDNGIKICISHSEYKLIYKSADEIECSPEIYWSVFKELLSGMLAKTKIPASEIKALSISSQGETFFPLDKNGNPCYNAIVWLDTRAKNEARQINRKFSSREFENISQKFSSDVIDSATKILWLKHNKPAVFKKARRFVLLEDYFCARLTGNYVLSLDNAWSTGMVDMNKQTWWKEMLDYIGVDESCMSTIVPTALIAGKVNKHASMETGLGEGTIVAAGSNDQSACSVAVGNIEEGIAAVTLGTALVILILSDTNIVNKTNSVISHKYVIKGKESILLFSKTMGIVLKWYRDNFMPGETYEDVTAAAAKSVPGANGLSFIPHFAGALFPKKCDGAKGSISGLSLKHTKNDIARSILESIAYSLQENREVVDKLKIRIKTVRAFGGAAKSDFILQIIADVLGLPIERPAESETGVLGAAIYAGVAAGVWKDISEAAGEVYRPGKRFIPRTIKEYSAAYKRYRDVFDRLYN